MRKNKFFNMFAGLVLIGLIMISISSISAADSDNYFDSYDENNFTDNSLSLNTSNNGYSNSYILGLNVSFNPYQALNDSKELNKTLILIFDQDSCSYCDQFEEETLKDSEVQAEINEYFIPVFVDVNDNYEMAESFEVYGTPTTVFLDENGSEVHSVSGFVGPDEFLNEIDSFKIKMGA